VATDAKLDPRSLVNEAFDALGDLPMAARWVRHEAPDNAAAAADDSAAARS
jgi:hypothetical protein